MNSEKAQDGEKTQDSGKAQDGEKAQNSGKAQDGEKAQNSGKTQGGGNAKVGEAIALATWPRNRNAGGVERRVGKEVGEK